MKFHIPIKLPSLSNTRMHWRAMASLKKKQRRAVWSAWLTVAPLTISEREKQLSLPLVVTITRVGPRRLDDDNLASAAKYVRDEIARIVGVDDGSPLYTWRYAQRTGPYGVDIEITAR